MTLGALAAGLAAIVVLVYWALWVDATDLKRAGCCCRYTFWRRRRVTDRTCSLHSPVRRVAGPRVHTPGHCGCGGFHSS